MLPELTMNNEYTCSFSQFHGKFILAKEDSICKGSDLGKSLIRLQMVTILKWLMYIREDVVEKGE